MGVQIHRHQEGQPDRISVQRSIKTLEAVLADPRLLAHRFLNDDIFGVVTACNLGGPRIGTPFPDGYFVITGYPTGVSRKHALRSERHGLGRHLCPKCWR